MSIAISLALGMGASVSAAVTRGQADSAYTAWYNLYWNGSNSTFFKKDNKTGRIDFWRYAHDWETIMDRYELTRDPVYVTQMKAAWTGFNRTNGMGTDWKQNDFNDDIEWWIISASRAYLLTKDTAYSNAAQKNFDWLYATQWDMTLGGGIWWKNNEKAGKHACSNGPAAVSALNLYEITKDAAYLDKAKAIYKWERGALFNANSGSVADNMRASGSVGGGALFYNQGTFLGPAYRLFTITGDSAYYRDAIKAIDYVKNSMSNRTTGILNNSGYTGDGATFLVIFIRNMMDVIRVGKQKTYLDWMVLNAESAWKNRRQSDNIMSSNFGSLAPASGLESSSSTGGVAILTLTVLATQPTGIVFRGKRGLSANLSATLGERFSVDGRKAAGKSNVNGDGNGKGDATPLLRRQRR